MSHRVGKQFLAFFRLSYCFVIVVAPIFADVAIWVRVICATVFVSSIVLSILILFSLFFQQATLISTMSCLFKVAVRWFESVGFSVCGTLAHSVSL